MSAHNDLVTLVPSPLAEPRACDWPAIEAQMGTPLPEDYKSLAETYGPGEFDETYTLHAPSAAGSPTDLVTAAREHADIMRSIREDLLEGRPLLVFPEPEGLLCWGTVSSGLSLCWQTSGPPDSWPVVVSDDTSMSVDTWRFEGGTVDFLLAVLNGSVEVPQLRDAGYAPAAQPTFAPFALDGRR